MLDNEALARVGQQLGNLAINLVSLERDLELQTETLTSVRAKLTLSEEELHRAIEQRDGLQREVHALNDQLRVLKKEPYDSSTV